MAPTFRPALPRMRTDVIRPRRAGNTASLACSALLACGITAPFPSAADTEHRVAVDTLDRPLPGEPPAGWFYNAMGGDRGLVRDAAGSADGVAVFSKPSASVYRGTVTRAIPGSQWEFFGFWESLGRPIQQRSSKDPNALFSALIRPEFQAKLVGVDVLVAGIASPSGRSDLTLRIELKGFAAGGQEVLRSAHAQTGRAALVAGPFPRTISITTNPTTLGSVGVLNVLLDRASVGDRLDVDDIHLRVRVPELPAGVEPLLFSLAMLLDNLDPATGMVQDRANFPNGDFENVTATAKLAKLLALGIQQNLVVPAAGTAAINQIAGALLTRVPRGAGNLWPHFTKAGGTIIAPNVEWASGDTSYAILDLMTALSLINDPSGWLTTCEQFLRSITWQDLYRGASGYSHGYRLNGDPLPANSNWLGFGTETMGVLLAALAGGGPLAEMAAPPDDNGSGFVLHAAYPQPPVGRDRWGNLWGSHRRAEVAKQLSWYSEPAHANPHLHGQGLFGLSAAERPEGWDPVDANIYQAYGTGGKFSPALDGGHRIVTPHYSGMVAPLVPEESTRMWDTLKKLGLASPMHLAESLEMDPSTGALGTVNYLKGSWNLALFAEGWMLTRPGAEQALRDAVGRVPSLARAQAILFPDDNAQPDWARVGGLPGNAGDYALAASGDNLLAAGTQPQSPSLFVADPTSPTAAFQRVHFNTNLLNSAYNHPLQITGLAVLRDNGVDSFFASTSGGILRVDPAADPAQALSPVWSFPWDTSFDLRVSGSNLVWTVGNFGSQSGVHAWNSASGHAFLHYSEYQWSSNRVRRVSDGEVFGWYDLRGFFWRGAAPPPLLLTTTHGSLDGGATWTALVDEQGAAVRVSSVAYADASRVFIVRQIDGVLMQANLGGPFRVMAYPGASPSGLAYDPASRRLVAGSSGSVHHSLFPASASPELSVQEPVGQDRISDDVIPVLFGTLRRAGPAEVRVVTLRNRGTSPLQSISVAKSGDQAGDFTLDQQGMRTSLNAGESTTFRVSFSPSAAGFRRAHLVIASTDPMDNPFVLRLLGTGVGPEGSSVVSRRPAFHWAATANATWYRVFVTRNGSTFLDQWIPGGARWNPSLDFPAGNYRWWVQGWGPSGFGTWSAALDFTILPLLPAAITQVAPSGPQASSTVTYRWTKDTQATWYRVWSAPVAGATFLDRWYQQVGTGQASVTVDALPQGNHTWWIQGWSPDGLGPWAGPMAFSVPSSDPAKPRFTGPVGTIPNRTPTFTWDAAERAQWYWVYVTRGTTKVIDQWTQTTSIPSPVSLAPGAHTAWLGAWNETTRRIIWSDPATFNVQ